MAAFERALHVYSVEYLLQNISRNPHGNTSNGDYIYICVKEYCFSGSFFAEHLRATSSANSLFSMWITQCMVKSNRPLPHSIFWNSTLETKQLALLFVYWYIHKTLLYMSIHQLFSNIYSIFLWFYFASGLTSVVLYKKTILKNLLNSQEKTCTGVSFLIKLQPEASKKETSTQAFSCEFCEIFKNISFKENLQTTASLLRVCSFKSSSNICDGTFCDYSNS